ncbi:MAG: glycosyltransferase [Candidatus Erginobacter occultus]|nr:glycosyltransferase [Candidatus Erginobacter occultus]
MINILVLVEDEKAPSCRFRWRQFIEPLAAEGLVLEIREIPRQTALRKRLFRDGEDFAGVILHRKLLRRGDFRRLRRFARRLIYDFDDAVMFRDSNASRLLSRARRIRFQRVVSGADLVIAGNEYLQQQASPEAGRTELIPTVVDIGTFPHRPTPGEGKVIGWMGTASNFVYLSLICNPLKTLLQDRPDIVFRVVADRLPELAGIPLDYRQWSGKQETAELAGFSVGIMPLFDDPWTRGKCAFKLLQYGAAFVPAVSSPVGANLSVIREGETGYFARSEGEWRRRLEELLDSPGKREEMGRSARRLVETKYSLGFAVPRLAQIIRRVVKE